MKASVETLGATRVKLSVEVPFEELRPSLDAAYKRFAQQVKVQGFRPGKVPSRILDQRVGRAAILEEAIQEAVPRFYADAVEEAQVPVAGRPDLELGPFADGAPLVFSATVDVRPEIDLPAYDGLRVTVDPAAVSDEDVDRQLDSLRDRFATLTGVDRAAQAGDFVQIDLSATRDGEPIPGSEASGLSYEVGSEGLVPGLDRALAGLAAGERKTFDAEIAYGELAGTLATFTVGVTAVKQKQVPELDDGFAVMASEFDTLAELRAGVRDRMERLRRIEQAGQARDRVLDALVGLVDVPLPESMVHEEVHWRQDRMEAQLAEIGLTAEDFLAQTGKSAEEVQQELEGAAREAVKAQLLLDAIARKEDLGVSDADLTDQVVRRALLSGVRPDDLADEMVRRGEIPELLAEVRRGNALSLVLRSATVVDSAGNPVDLSELPDDAPGAP